jgi:hypothetical protein
MSGGFKKLDASAVTALRQWRWKPGTWRQVAMRITFALPRLDRERNTDVFGRGVPSYPPAGVVP